MNFKTPAQVASARTARLVREVNTPVYSTSTPTQAQIERDLIQRAEDLACGDDFCHICKRCTDHWGEHSDAQILKWAKTPSMVQSLLK